MELNEQELFELLGRKEAELFYLRKQKAQLVAYSNKLSDANRELSKDIESARKAKPTAKKAG